MSRAKRQRSYSGTTWQPVLPEPSRVEPRRGVLVLKSSSDRSPVRRAPVEDLLGTVERKLRQR